MISRTKCSFRVGSKLRWSIEARRATLDGCWPYACVHRHKRSPSSQDTVHSVLRIKGLASKSGGKSQSAVRRHTNAQQCAVRLDGSHNRATASTAVDSLPPTSIELLESELTFAVRPYVRLCR